MTFADLNLDCKLLILEQMNFDSLLNMAALNPDYLDLANYIFKRKYHNKEFLIREPFRGPKLPAFESSQFDLIELRNLDLITKVFQTFGPMISKVKINYGKNATSEVRTVIDLVNRHCAALTHFELFGSIIDKDLLNDVQTPFHRVDTVSLHGTFNKLASKSLYLNEIFPKIRSLSLDYVRFNNHSDLVLKFPHLEHLSITLEVADLRPVIAVNPQIRNLSLHACSLPFLKYLSDHLVNLEALSLKWIALREVNFQTEILFNNIKSLKVVTFHPDLPSVLNAPKLEDLEMDWSALLRDNWMQFFRKHTNLTTLRISQNEIGDDDLAFLASNVNHLVEAAFLTKPEVTAPAIVQFVKSSSKLQKLEISYKEQFPIEEYNALQKQIANEWKFTNGTLNWTIEKKLTENIK